jgi:hypothetical protein
MQDGLEFQELNLQILCPLVYKHFLHNYVEIIFKYER